MGLAVAGDRLAVAAREWIYVLRYREGLAVESAFFTGRLDAHDLAFDRRGLLFANTRFNCVARPSETVHFRRHWRPAFMEAASKTDCCHLNGVGVRDGRLAMVTAFCENSAAAAWRAGDRFSSGVLIDVRRGEAVLRGLCMPHSPRWHAERWWLNDSGVGALVSCDCDGGDVRTVAVVPGFTRGLTLAAGRALVGLSRIRRQHILDAPPVRQRFPALRAGLSIVDAAAGRETGFLEFVRGGREVYDVAYLPDVINIGKES
jgi:uncharacterized protein (TIGR03032 family)